MEKERKRRNQWLRERREQKKDRTQRLHAREQFDALARQLQEQHTAEREQQLAELEEMFGLPPYERD
jgi:hypothetical protein